MAKHKKSNNTNISLLIGGLVILVLISCCLAIAGFIISNRLQNSSAGNAITLDEVSSKCFNEGGHWIAASKECEKVSEPFCRSLGGTFNACASPCRNAGGEVMCIQMCVQVCTFK